MKFSTSQSTRFLKRIFACTAIAGCLFGSSGGQAATIIWDPATISGESDVSTEGVLKQALNIGLTVGVTLNGVNFTAANPSGQTNVTTIGTGEGALQLALPSGTWAVYASNTFAPNPATTPPFGNLTPDYQTFLQSATSPSATSATYTLLNLEVGQEYLLQFWVNDSRASTREDTLTAGNSVIMDFNVNGSKGYLGTVVSGTFTADSASQLISVSASAGDVNVIQLNGYQLRAIPEPSVSVLVGLAFGFTLFRRHGRRSS